METAKRSDRGATLATHACTKHMNPGLLGTWVSRNAFVGFNETPFIDVSENREGSKKSSARRFHGRFVTKKKGSRLTKFTKEFVGKIRSGSGSPSLVDVPPDGSGELVADGHKECTCSDTKLVYFFGGGGGGGFYQVGAVKMDMSPLQPVHSPTWPLQDQRRVPTTIVLSLIRSTKTIVRLRLLTLQLRTRSWSHRLIVVGEFWRRCLWEGGSWSSVSLLKDFSVVATLVGEKFGLASVFDIKCQRCGVLNKLQTIFACVILVTR